MKNCLIMGFGRSGTSLMGGILHQAGYYMGEDLYPGRDSNPKGFFENALINGINEKILKNYDYALSHPGHPASGEPFSPYHPGEGHRWLAYIPLEVKITEESEDIKEAIRKAVSYNGFAYKDPRFNYTLKIWAPFLNNETLLICVFRDPAITVQSILTECERAEYLSGFHITKDLAEELWLYSYSHLFQNLKKFSSDQIIFVHYEKLLSGEALPGLSRRLGIRLSDDFASPGLNRTTSGAPVGLKATTIYQKLCNLADVRLNSTNFTSS